MMAARKSQPVSVQVAFTSVTQTGSGRSAVKLRARRLGAIRLVLRLSVVALKRFLGRAWRLRACMMSATVFFDTRSPRVTSTFCTRGATEGPARLLEHGLDLRRQLVRATLSGCRRTALPAVEARRRDAEGSTQRGDWEVCLLRRPPFFFFARPMGPLPGSSLRRETRGTPTRGTPVCARRLVRT